jgi:hypothetical protein
MSVAHDGHVVIDLPAQVIHISQDDLRVIVQAAYDSYGILAAPSYDVEAERAPEVPDVLGMIHAHVNAAHEAQARTVAARYPLLAAAKVSA